MVEAKNPNNVGVSNLLCSQRGTILDLYYCLSADRYRAHHLMNSEFTNVFERVWNDFRARWCERSNLAGACAFSHDEIKIVMFHRVTQVDVADIDVDRLIDAAIQFYRRKRYDCVFTLSPLDRPRDLEEHLQRRRFERVLLPVAMLCDQPAEPFEAEGIEVEVIGGSQYDTWASIMCTCFGNPSESGEIGRKFVDLPEIRLYLARRNGEPAGTALMVSNHGMGYIDAVGTLPTHRRQGVASAIIARIVEDSEALGNRWTALEVESNSNAEQLYHRCGFRRMHFRPRYSKLTQ